MNSQDNKATTLVMTFAAKDNPHSGKPSVPFEKWGHDHWLTFAYLECRAVDNGGKIDIQHMRCDPTRHPGLVNSANRTWPKSKYPSLLKGGELQDNHDDWDCFEDLIAMGLCTWEGTGIHPEVAFTEKGRKLASLLREHKAAGGQFKTFDPSDFWKAYGHSATT